jgi:predicted NAD-dependent protein-ADP-ribosyltransferase YbiA (DUF1768 family)
MQYHYGQGWVDRNGQSVRHRRRGARSLHVLENEFPAEVTYEDAVYPSAFHAYQAARFAEASAREPLRVQRSAGPRAMSVHEARVYGGRDLPLVPGFVERREAIMRDVLRAKFTANHQLLLALLRTGDAELRYDAPSPTWGCHGRNAHGRLLMELRAELRASVQQLWAAANHAETSEEPESDHSPCVECSDGSANAEPT